MHKIIFLDIDGVLNNTALGTKDKEIWKLFNDIDTDGGRLSSINIKNLNDITDQTGADIVISSTWRILHEFHDLVTILKDAGVTGNIIDYTPGLGGRGIRRGNEIQCYIEDHYPSAYNYWPTNLRLFAWCLQWCHRLSTFGLRKLA